MSDSDTTDPSRGIQTKGTPGTASLRTTGANRMTTSGSSIDRSSWATQNFASSSTSELTGTSGSINKKITDLEGEIAQLNQLLMEIRNAQAKLGYTNASDLLVQIDSLSTEVDSINNELDEITGDKSNVAGSEATKTPQHQKEASAGTTMEDTYIKISQVVFLLLAVVATAVSIWLASSTVGLVATFTVPILLLLSFGGVMVERTMIQSSV
ncbi:hypothetical protein [Haloferax prahovense]|uniref:hypothetical protein n=1 Tax=Haloferax prahovense TaxID=381852 RepID=UPI0012DE2EF8|nr:hypothetical protein [Haloferax prahovense]